jgi:curved DNA-binding protein CbpA
MSIEIDFNSLKYNLYEILNVDINDDEKKIKKKFIHVIKNFHPDKNSELEEDIYYHIILANQILLNKKNREKYNEFILGTSDMFYELKNNFNKFKNNNLLLNNDNHNEFNNKCKELDNKYLNDINEDDEPLNIKYENIIKNRNNISINYDSEIINNNIFNNKFINKKENEISNKLDIIEYLPYELICDNKFTFIDNINKLYIEDTITTDKFTSLDKAFILQPNFDYKNNKSYKEKIEEYNNDTELYYKHKNV